MHERERTRRSNGRHLNACRTTPFGFCSDTHYTHPWPCRYIASVEIFDRVERERDSNWLRSREWEIFRKEFRHLHIYSRGPTRRNSMTRFLRLNSLSLALSREGKNSVEERKRDIYRSSAISLQTEMRSSGGMMHAFSLSLSIPRETGLWCKYFRNFIIRPRRPLSVARAHILIADRSYNVVYDGTFIYFWIRIERRWWSMYR